MSPEEQLLFALLAHQNDFITQTELLAGFSKWLINKRQYLPDLLIQDGALTADDCQLLKRLVTKHLEKFSGDASVSLANLSGVSSIAEELRCAAQKDSDALATVSFLHGRRDSTQTQPSGESAAKPIKIESDSNRFRIIKEHARGGLGVVFVAEDRDLKREVALKQIRQDRSSQNIYRYKFTQEAEVTGQLEHPGIVPVYALGSDPQGRPYYAMRFIRGEDLKSRIAKFHADVKEKKHAYDGPELRGLLRRFIDVCNAVDYAHDRGVLHRDLKPGNVMLGKYGETLVVDWGLAKPFGQKLGNESESTQSFVSELPVAVDNSDDQATEQGSFLGTVTYAPPEQLLGQLDQLCPQSDVYALGVILFELLSGYLPWERFPSAKALAEHILENDAPKPIERLTRVPRPLNALCIRALEPKIDDRYSSAKELRKDIEHWLDDEVVTAYREPVTDKFQRWTRKHKGLYSLAVGTLVTLTLASLVIYGLQTKANKQIAKERDAATISAKEAEAERDKTEQLLAKSNFNLSLARWDANRTGESREFHAKIPEKYRHIEWELAREKLKGSDLTCIGHTAAVTAVKVSHDGSFIVSASKDGTIRRWDPITGKPLYVITAHEKGVNCLALSADSSKIFSGGADHAVSAWDASTGSLLGCLYSHTSEVVALDVNVTGTVLASCSGKIVELWSIAENKKLASFSDKNFLASLDFGPDPNLLLYGTSNGYLVWFDLETQKIKKVSSKEDDTIRQVAVSAHGNNVAVAYMGFRCRQYKSISFDELTTMTHGKFRPQCIAYSSNGRWVATGSEKLRVWDDRNSGDPIEFNGHDGMITTVDWFPNSERIVTGSSDNSIRIWDNRFATRYTVLSKHEKLLPNNGLAIRSVSICSEAKYCVSTNWAGQVRVWDISTHEVITELSGTFVGAFFVADTTSFLAVSSEGKLTRFEALGEKTEEMALIPGETVSKFAVSENGEFAVISAGINVFLFNLPSKTIVASHQCKGTVQAVSIDTTGKRIAIGVERLNREQGPSVLLWTPADDSLSNKPFDKDCTSIACLRFSHNSKYLAIGAGQETQLQRLELIQVETLDTVHFLRGRYLSLPTSLEFSDDDRRIFSSWSDKTVRIHDTMNGDEVLLLDGPSRGLQSIAIDGNNHFIIAGGSLGEVFLWTTDTDNDAYQRSKARLHESWQEKNGREASAEKDWFAASHAYHTLLKANPQIAARYIQLYDAVDKWLSSSSNKELAKHAAQPFLRSLDVDPGTEGTGEDLWQVADRLRLKKREIADRYYMLAIERLVVQGKAIDVLTQARVIWLTKQLQAKNASANVEQLLRYLPDSIDRKTLAITSDFVSGNPMNALATSVWNLGFDTHSFKTRHNNGMFEIQLSFQPSSLSSSIHWGEADKTVFDQILLNRISDGYIPVQSNELEVAGRIRHTVLFHRTNNRWNMIQKGDQLHQSLRAKFLNGRYSKRDDEVISELADYVSQFKKAEWLSTLGLAYNLQGKYSDAISVIEKCQTTGGKLDSTYQLGNRLHLFLAQIKLGDKTSSTKAGSELFHYISQNWDLPYYAFRQTLIDNASVIAENSEVNKTSITALYRLSLGISQNLGTDFESGVVWLNRANAICQVLRKDPKESEAIDWLMAEVKALVCNLQLRMKRYDEAIDNGTSAQTTFKAKLESSGTSRPIRAINGLASTLVDLGDAYDGKSDVANSLASRTEAVSIYRELLAMDSNNAMTHRNLSIALERLGMSLEPTSPQDALKHYEEGLQVANKAIVLWPNDLYLGRHFSVMCRHAAEAQLKLGIESERIVSVEKGLENLRRMQNSGLLFADLDALANVLNVISMVTNSDKIDLTPFVGKYQYGAAVMTVSVENGRLFAQLPDRPKHEIFPTGENVFRWLAVQAQVEFVQDDQGFVTKAKHTQGGTTFEAPKLK